MHTFGKQQAWQSGRYPIHASPPRGTHFRNLPPPIGKARFRPDIKDAVAAPVYAAMVKSKKVIFHLTGDMGGIAYAVPRELVASVMESDFKSVVSGGQLPAFLYITGDCVYFTGQVSEYYRQFYQPYEFYRAPIFAVPGNPDGENLPTNNTLDGFVRNFCGPKPVKMPEPGDSHRTAMIQPNGKRSS